MKKYFYYIIFFTSICCFSQTAGSLDMTFNSIDSGFDEISGTNSRVLCTAIQPDGKIIIGGSFTKYNGELSNKIARLNIDGTLDTSFITGSGFTTLNPNVGIDKILIEPNGKILVSGSFTSYNGTICKDVIRLNSDGQLDSTFNIGLGFNNSINQMKLQANGKILLCGAFTSFNNFPVNYLIRLNNDGSLDNTFDNTNSGANSAINDLIVLSNNKIVVIGNFTFFSGSQYNRIAMLNDDGTLDNNFNPGTGFQGSPFSIIDDNGKIIVGGNFTSYNSIQKKFLIRINLDGSYDTTFLTGTGPFTSSGNLTDTYQVVRKIVRQQNGQIILIGEFESYNGNNFTSKIARINNNGILDNSFIVNPELFFVDYLYHISSPSYPIAFRDLSIQADGKIILSGQFQTSTFSGANIKRLDVNGLFDNSFNTKKLSGANSRVNKIILQQDGKILVGGEFTLYNSNFSNGIVKLQSDGSYDGSFNSPLYSFTNVKYSKVYDFMLENDNTCLILGDLYTDENNSGTIESAKRLFSNGTFDTNFISPILPACRRSIAILPDGKTIRGGSLNTNNFGRFNNNGGLDNSFNIGTSFNGGVNVVKIQSDGKILIGGSFSNYNGINKNGIVRLNANGIYDSTFIGSGTSTSIGTTGTVKSIVIQNDGKILIGGIFDSYNGVISKSLVRINNDGTIDSSFTLSTDSFSGVNRPTINSISLQADGKIIIVGDFTRYNGNNVNNIIRLNNDGTIDTTFNSGSGTDNIIHSSIIQPDGKIIIAGDFTSYNGIGRNRIARINLNNTLSNTNFIITKTCSIYPNPTNDKITIDCGNLSDFHGFSVKITNMLGQEVFNQPMNTQQYVVPLNTWTGQGMYFVKIINAQNEVVNIKKIILQ